MTDQGQRPPFADGAQARRQANVASDHWPHSAAPSETEGVPRGSTLTLKRSALQNKPLTGEVDAAVDAPFASRLDSTAHEGLVPRLPAGRLPPARALDQLAALVSPRAHRQRLRDWRMRHRSEDVDEFGFDPLADQRWRPWLSLLYRDYRRASALGVEHVPDRGRVLLVANHSGIFPMDALMLMRALRLDHPASRALRPLLDDELIHAPFVGPWLQRLGCARACQANGLRLLEQEQAVLVFPEGAKGRHKSFRQRYRLGRFGRGGFVRLSLRADASIVPVAVMGTEETYLGLPLPSRWTIRFAPPITLGPHDRTRAEHDPVFVAQLSDQVRHQIQRLLDSSRQILTETR